MPRIHDGLGGTYLWVANLKRKPTPVRLEIDKSLSAFASSHSLWQAEAEVAD
jgi:hypothetical protein